LLIADRERLIARSDRLPDFSTQSWRINGESTADDR
jgi:hypothetical protein